MIFKTPFILLWGLVVLWLLGALIFVVFNVIVVVIAMFTGDSGKVVGVIVVVSVGRNTEVISILFNFFKLCNFKYKITLWLGLKLRFQSKDVQFDWKRVLVTYISDYGLFLSIKLQFGRFFRFQSMVGDTH
jgi:hypothetical protein